jgi:hypothetical protein
LNIPLHSSIRVRATVLKIDNWPSKSFKVYIDNTLVQTLLVTANEDTTLGCKFHFYFSNQANLNNKKQFVQLLLLLKHTMKLGGV